MLMGRLMLIGMKDQGEMQVHQSNLMKKFLDIGLISLIGLNEGMEDIKRKTAYSMINDVQLFDDIKKVETTIVEGSDDVDDEEEKELSEFGKGLIKACKLEYERAFMNFLSRVSLKQADLVRKILLELPKKAILNFQNPLILSEFLTHYLD
jgi:hypothetical protein